MSYIRAVIRAAALAASVQYNAFVASARLADAVGGVIVPSGDYIENGYVEPGYI